jgi:nitroreductase
VILLDTILSPSAELDAGIAAQTILLGAVEKGLGGCMVGNIRREELSQVLSLPGHLSILLVLALGKPVESIELEDPPPGGSVKYYRDGGGRQHVPKRALAELIHESYS